MAVVVLDSAGCGLAPDADQFGDLGANTLGHVIERVSPPLPNLTRLGLGHVPGVPLPTVAAPAAATGRMHERAPGKDTMLGHWELMGVVADAAFPLYPDGFPAAVIDRFSDHIGTEILGNRAASGTDILDELGAEHIATARPIVYTSGDSVFQVAAHERVISIPRLYEMCAFAREMLQGEHAVGRVIARPFRGEGPGRFERTPQRKDLPLPPPRPTVLDNLSEAGVAVHAVGKIHDIFAGRGISSYAKTDDNAAGVEETIRALHDRAAPFVFTNLVDFDSRYGHRNDVAGYGACLAEFDAALPGMLEALPADGCLILTADHGNDPTWPGTDHTRESVPLLVAGPAVAARPLGDRVTFADLGRTVLDNFGIDGDAAGSSFLPTVVPGG